MTEKDFKLTAKAITTIPGGVRGHAIFALVECFEEAFPDFDAHKFRKACWAEENEG